MIIPTELLPLNHPDAFNRASWIIRSGGVIAFPTDTVYGIGASAFNETAIEKIYQVKKRSHLKAIPILISDASELSHITTPINPLTNKIINTLWPGALTLVLPIHPNLPGNLSEGDSIGVRVPDHDLVQDLLRVTGPIAATSANLSGNPSALTAAEVIHQLEGSIDLILDGGPAPGGMASTVLDCTREEPALLREGPVSWEQIALNFK